MSNRYLIKKNRTKKGISPVVATVILVAVAVVIAAALAGFAGSLFGSYSNGPQVKIQSFTMDTTGAGTLTMSNAGNAADTVKSISISNFGTATGAADIKCTCTAGDNVIPANTNSLDYDVTIGTPGPMTAGTQVTAVVQLQSGSSITQTLTMS